MKIKCFFNGHEMNITKTSRFYKIQHGLPYIYCECACDNCDYIEETWMPTTREVERNKNYIEVSFDKNKVYPCLVANRDCIFQEPELCKYCDFYKGVIDERSK